MRCGPSGFLSIGDDILHSNPLLQYIPDLTSLYVLQFRKPPSIATSCVCVCANGRLSQFCSGRTGKTYTLCSLCCLVSGKRGCSNLHCFACWLMLCLWERCAWCEVNSCALQYHCIPLFSVSSLSVCYSFTGKGKARTKQLCRMWCHYLHSENVPIGKVW